jgi:pimeloyl-ACP methyl ester carboxylesterase
MTEDLSVLSRAASAPDRTLRYGPEPDQVADFRSGVQGAQRPLIVLIHGGFWKPAYDRAHAQPMAQALAEAGWSVLTLEYRRIPGQPDAMLQDIACAISVLPGQVEQHKGKLLLVGHSAGGHLALWAAACGASDALCGVLALAPAADLGMAQRLNLGDGAVLKFLGAAAATRADVDPVRQGSPTVAVTLLQGEQDEVVPLAVAQSYAAAFPRTRLAQLPDAGHFALIDPLSSAWSQVLQELERLSVG